MQMDDKFEEALNEVAKSVQGLNADGAGVAGAEGGAQLNDKLEGKFSQNLLAISDQLTALNK
jgi:hypothetical protein